MFILPAVQHHVRRPIKSPNQDSGTYLSAWALSCSDRILSHCSTQPWLRGASRLIQFPTVHPSQASVISRGTPLLTHPSPASGSCCADSTSKHREPASTKCVPKTHVQRMRYRVQTKCDCDEKLPVILMSVIIDRMLAMVWPPSVRLRRQPLLASGNGRRERS